MSRLQSYHLEVVNQIEGEHPIVKGSYGIFSGQFTLTADVQPDNKGSRYHLRDADGESPGLDVGGRFYDSAEGDKVWHIPDTDGGIGLWVAMFVRLLGSGPEHYSLVRDITSGLLAFDNTNGGANHAQEESDGVVTRRITANIEDLRNQDIQDRGSTAKIEGSALALYAMSGGKSITFWITTDISPTIRQMQVEGILYEYNAGAGIATPIDPKDEKNYKQVNFRATWKWSRFNEDFGEVKPPPTETIKSP